MWEPNGRGNPTGPTTLFFRERVPTRDDEVGVVCLAGYKVARVTTRWPAVVDVSVDVDGREVIGLRPAGGMTQLRREHL